MRRICSNIEISNDSYFQLRNTQSLTSTMSDERCMAKKSISSDNNLNEEKFQKLTVYNFINDDSEYSSVISYGTL